MEIIVARKINLPYENKVKQQFATLVTQQQKIITSVKIDSNI